MTGELQALHRAAACADADPALFDEAAWTPRTVVALRYCAVCPVPVECRRLLVLPRAQFDGVAGGRVWRNGRPLPAPQWATG